jgi:hypothetical protein
LPPGVDDGAGVAVDDQELVGLHRLVGVAFGAGQMAQVGEHQATVAVAIEERHSHPAL